MTASGEAAPACQRIVRDLLVVALAITTGCVDAVCFLHLGRVFGSVITGNLVLLGVFAGEGTAAVARSAGLALAGYAVGVAVGAPIARERDRRASVRVPHWPARVTFCLGAEMLVLAAFSAGWEEAGGHPAGASRLVLLAVAAAAMGMQSEAVRRLGQISTTYLTSTLTGAVAALVLGEMPEGLLRSAGVLLAAVAGAVAGAVTTALARGLLPLVALAPVGLVVAGSQALRTGR